MHTVAPQAVFNNWKESARTTSETSRTAQQNSSCYPGPFPGQVVLQCCMHACTISCPMHRAVVAVGGNPRSASRQPPSCPAPTPSPGSALTILPIRHRPRRCLLMHVLTPAPALPSTPYKPHCGTGRPGQADNTRQSVAATGCASKHWAGWCSRPLCQGAPGWPSGAPWAWVARRMTRPQPAATLAVCQAGDWVVAISCWSPDQGLVCWAHSACSTLARRLQVAGAWHSMGRRAESEGALEPRRSRLGWELSVNGPCPKLSLWAHGAGTTRTATSSVHHVCPSPPRATLRN